jgi:ABC-type bacteriocin/lantibiotic exporter with double-glycine peptidase domain
MKTLRFIWLNLDHFRTRLFLTGLAALATGILNFYFLILITEFTKSGFSVERFWILLTELIIIYAVNLILAYLVRNYGEPILKQFSNYLKIKYFQKLESLKPARIQTTHSGYIYSIINSVASGMTAICFDLLWNYPITIAQLTIYFIYLGMESGIVALINFVIFAVFITVSLNLSRKMAVLAKELNLKEAGYVERLVDFMTNVLTIRKLGINDYAREKLDHLQRINSAQIAKNSHAHAVRWFILHTIFGVAFLGTLGFFLYFISINVLSPSILILFVAALNQVKGLIERLSESIKSLLEMDSYIGTLENIFSDKEEVTGQVNPRQWAVITIEDFSYRHPENNRQISIKNLTIKRSDKICIYGESGQGKSTILNVIINFIKPEKEVRKIDRHAYTEIAKEFFIREMIYVAQEVELFNLSLRENVSLGKKISDQEIQKHLEELGLTEWFSSLENGLDTIIGEKGTKLSAGQKQRINLLRSVIMDKEIYLLDEPTSHLDEHTEKILINYINKYLRHKTLIIVTHREAIKELCDKFYRIENHKLEAA